MDFFKSFGLKRRFASALLALAGLLSTIPGAAQYSVVISELAGVIGGGGLLHALWTGNIGKFKIATVVSILASIIAIAPTIPVLAAYQPILQAILVLLGTLGATDQPKEEQLTLKPYGSDSES